MFLTIFFLIEVFVMADLVFYTQYRRAIPGTLARHRLSIISQLMLLGGTLAWLAWAGLNIVESHPWWVVQDVFVAAVNIFVWRVRGYDDDLWDSTKRGAKRAAKRLRAAMPKRSGALRPAGGLA